MNRLLSGARIGGAALLLLFLGYAWLIPKIPLDFFAAEEAFNARSLPWVLAAVGILLSLGLMLGPDSRSDPQALLLQLKEQKWSRGAVFIALMLGYAWVLEGLGFIVATLLLLFGGCLLMGERRWHFLLPAALPLPFLLALLMWLLGIQLPYGSWWYLPDV